MSHIKYLSSASLKSHEMTLHAFHKVGVVWGGSGGMYIYASLNICIYIQPCQHLWKQHFTLSPLHLQNYVQN